MPINHKNAHYFVVWLFLCLLHTKTSMLDLLSYISFYGKSVSIIFLVQKMDFCMMLC